MMFLMFSLIFTTMFGSLLTGAGAAAQGAESGFLTRTVTVGSERYTYQVFVPAHLAGKRDVPVIVFLHGIGQRGDGGFIPTAGAASTLARHFLEQMQGVVILPQCRKGKYWHEPEMQRMVMAQLDQAAAEFTADRKRLYLLGVSMGGYGAWHMAAEHPGKFAAVVPICGGSTLTKGDRFTPLAKKIGSTPVWAFHGSEDRVVPVSESREMVGALKKVSGNRVRYSEYKGVGHNVWLNAAAEPELMKWLLEQKAD